MKRFENAVFYGFRDEDGTMAVWTNEWDSIDNEAETSAVDDFLPKMGALGWELVSVQIEPNHHWHESFYGDSQSPLFHYYFKREIPSRKPSKRRKVAKS